MIILVIRGLLAFVAKDLALEYLPHLVATIAVAVYVVVATVIWSFGVIAQPGGIYWLAAQAPPSVQAAHPLGAPHTTTGIDVTPSGTPIALSGGDGTPIPVAPVGPIAGRVTDAQRYALAWEAGWNTVPEAIEATAISIAEDGSGDPRAVSRPNFNGTVDIGPWQDNSAHIGSYGIPSMEWLFVPINNARAAHAIYGPGHNWCAWSTYGTVAQCGPGHNNAAASWEACAIQISLGRIEQCPR